MHRLLRAGFRLLTTKPWFLDRSRRLNHLYDKCTLRIMQRVLTASSNAVDVGCHTGQILRRMMELAPQGRHFAFEPIPSLAQALRERFPGVSLHEIALSDSPGVATFQHVLSRPAYSGLRKRNYPRENETVLTIEVRTAPLDDLLPPDVPIHLLKVDVEGGELGVFRGAARTIAEYKPYIIFEHGLGAAEFYGTRPESVYDLLVGKCGLRISLLPDWLQDRPPLSREDFIRHFDQRLNFYFLAHPERSSYT